MSGVGIDRPCFILCRKRKSYAKKKSGRKPWTSGCVLSKSAWSRRGRSKRSVRSATGSVKSRSRSIGKGGTRRRKRVVEVLVVIIIIIVRGRGNSQIYCILQLRQKLLPPTDGGIYEQLSFCPLFFDMLDLEYYILL